jgi:hypothetical protein
LTFISMPKGLSLRQSLISSLLVVVLRYCVVIRCFVFARYNSLADEVKGTRTAAVTPVR